MPDPDRTINRWIVLASFFAFGCAAALGQVLILREFLVTFHGTEICIGAFYGFWFFWIAAGAWAGPRILARITSEASAYLALHLAFPAAVLVELVLLRTLRQWTGVEPNQLVRLETLLLWSAAISLPAGAIIGTLFPITGRLLAGHTRDPISLGYAWESLGSLTGGVAFTYLLATRFDPLVTLAATGILEGITVLVVATSIRSRGGQAAAALACAAYVCLLTPLGAALDRSTEAARWRSLQRGYELVAVKHTPYSHVAVGRDPAGQYGIFFDGIQRTTFPDVERFEQEAALAMAQRPAAREVLLLGGGAEGLAQRLLTFPIRHLDCLEDDPWALSVVRRFLPPGEQAALADPRLRLIPEDGRLFVNQRGRRDRHYDLVISRAGDPTTASLNRYYTREFFVGVRRLLAPGGVLVLSSVSTGAHEGPEALRAAASVWHTLRGVFPAVELVHAGTTLLVASREAGAVSGDPVRLAGALAALPMPGAGRNSDLVRGAVSVDRGRQLRRQLAATEITANTDARPTTYFQTIQLLGRRSGSELTGLLGALDRAGVWVFVLALLVLGVARLGYRLSAPDPQRSQRTNTAIAIGVTGFASMALQIMILMGFQSHLGSLYQKVGLLTGVFMMGLAGGAMAGRAAAGRLPAPKLQLAAAMVVLAGFALGVAKAIAWLAASANGGAELGYYAMSGTCGLITGSLFPLSVASYDPAGSNVGRTAAVLDAADHVGACLGGLLAGTVIVPVAGLGATGKVIALAASVPAVLLAVDWSLERLGWRQHPLTTARWSFPWIRASWLLAALAVGVLACSTLVRCHPPPGPATVQKPFPHRPSYRSEARPPTSTPHPPTPPLPGSRTLTEVGLETRFVAGDVRGYGGPINLWVRFDRTGTLLEATLRSHDETPAYITGVPAWLDRLEGHRFTRPFRGRDGVDAISGATVTCEAILRALERARGRAASDLLGLAPPLARTPAPPSRLGAVLTSPRALAVLGLLILITLAFLAGGPIIRLVGLVASVIVLGFWLNVPFTLVDVGSLALGHLPGAAEKTALVAGVLLLGVAFGQVFCGYACPFGALQELLWLALHPRGLQGGAGLGPAALVSTPLEQRARYLKYPLLVLTLSFFWVSGNAAYVAWDPMTQAFSGRLVALPMGLLAIIAAASLLHLRPFCRYLCPAGALLSVLNKVSLLDRFAPRRVPGRCDLGVITLEHVDCLRCNRCVPPVRPDPPPPG